MSDDSIRSVRIDVQTRNAYVVGSDAWIADVETRAELLAQINQLAEGIADELEERGLLR